MLFYFQKSMIHTLYMPNFLLELSYAVLFSKKHMVRALYIQNYYYTKIKNYNANIATLTNITLYSTKLL